MYFFHLLKITSQMLIIDVCSLHSSAETLVFTWPSLDHCHVSREQGHPSVCLQLLTWLQTCSDLKCDVTNVPSDRSASSLRCRVSECPTQVVDIVISEYCLGQETLALWSRYCGDWGLVLSLTLHMPSGHSMVYTTCWIPDLKWKGTCFQSQVLLLRKRASLTMSLPSRE